MFIMQQPKQPTRPALAPTSAPAGELQMPRTRAEFDALVARREELKSQLQSVTERRRELFPQSMLARDAGARSELNARIAALDQRSARLEQEILAADDAIATAAGRGIPGPAANNFGQLIRQMTIPSRRQDTRQVIANVVLGEALAFVLLGVVLWQFLWKRNWARMRTMGTSVD